MAEKDEKILITWNEDITFDNLVEGADHITIPPKSFKKGEQTLVIVRELNEFPDKVDIKFEDGTSVLYEPKSSFHIPLLVKGKKRDIIYNNVPSWAF